MNDVFLNIAGKKHKDSGGKRRVKRAFDGMSIVLRSASHKKALQQTGASEHICDAMTSVIQQKLGTFGQKKEDETYVSKEDLFKDLNKKEAFKEIYTEMRKDKTEAIDEAQAEAVFKVIKQEANIVASSSGFMLFAGKLTSRLSQLPILGSFIAGMNHGMRKVPFIGKYLGDIDVNNPNNLEEKGEGVFDISMPQNDRSEREEEEKAGPHRIEVSTPDRTEERVDEKDTPSKSNYDELAQSTTPLTPEQKKSLIDNASSIAITSMLNNEKQEFTNQELESYAQHENKKVRSAFVRSKQPLSADMMLGLLSDENLEGETDAEKKKNVEQIACTLLSNARIGRVFEEPVIDRLFAFNSSQIDQSLVELKQHQLGEKNINELLRRYEKGEYDDKHDGIVYKGKAIEIIHGLAQGSQELTEIQFDKILSFNGNIAQGLASSPRVITPEQRKKLASSLDVQVQNAYHTSQLGHIASEYKTLEQHIDFDKKDEKGNTIISEEAQKIVASITAKIKDYKESLPEGGVPDYLDRYFTKFKALYDLQKCIAVAEITEPIQTLVATITGDALLAQSGNTESKALTDFWTEFEEHEIKGLTKKIEKLNDSLTGLFDAEDDAYYSKRQECLLEDGRYNYYTKDAIMGREAGKEVIMPVELVDGANKQAKQLLDDLEGFKEQSKDSTFYKKLKQVEWLKDDMIERVHDNCHAACNIFGSSGRHEVYKQYFKSYQALRDCCEELDNVFASL